MDTTDAAGSATTLFEVLGALKESGYSGHLIAQEDANVRCTSCDEHHRATSIAADGFRRLEGASDAADMILVVWGACPACHHKGAITLGYGPNATEADTSVLEMIDLDQTTQPGATPEEADELDTPGPTPATALPC